MATDLAALQKLIGGEQPTYVTEQRYFTKQGTLVWANVTVSLVRHPDGEPDYFIAVIEDISDRKQTEALLQNLIAGTAATTGQDFFPALVRHIAEALQVDYAIVAQLIEGRLHVFAFWANGILQPPFNYLPAKTPCERTLKNGTFYCASDVQQDFPDDLDLVMMKAESYLGIALQDSQEQVIGNLCILSQTAIHNPQWAEQLLRVFGARAAAELERQRASTLLEQLNQDLEANVKERTATLQEREQFLQTLLDTSPYQFFGKIGSLCI